MSWGVILLKEVEVWYFTLDDDVMAAVTGAIDLLERPAGTSVRILFIFDPRRQAILLLGGGNRGQLEELVRQEHSGRRTAVRELLGD
jgi:hypothetical protein